MGYDSTTNVGLQKPIDENVISQDVDALQGIVTANSDLLEKILGGITTLTTNATIVATGGKRLVQMFQCSAGSIATITGMLTGVPFTIQMMGSGATISLADTAPYLLASAWAPNTKGSNITLVWDGTNMIEVGRVTA